MIAPTTRPRPSLTVVEITFTEEGWHNWPGAPDSRSYLRDMHRHLFHIAVGAKVDHHERMIEFHDLLAMAKGAWHGAVELRYTIGNLGPQSCETMAQKLGESLIDSGVPIVYVSVSEDAEVTSTVHWSVE